MNQGSPIRRKKVLFLITKATFGGAQRYIFDLATNLSHSEYDCGVAYGTPGRLSEMLDTQGVATLHLPSLQRDVGLLSDMRSVLEIRQAIKDAEPDILHLNSSKAAAIGAVVGRLLGVQRIVFTVHGWPFKESRNAFSRAIIYFISWMTAALSTEVITVSSTDADIARKMFFVRHKVRHIPLGRDLLNTAPPHEAFRDMCGSHPPPPIREETIRIVSIAELTANKDIHSGIDAVAELVRRGVDCVYVVAGDGEEREALEQHARAVGVDDHVCLSGFIPDAARYLSGFDVYLLPSIKEGMPYVLIEASLAGLPIVATSVIDEEFALQLGRTKIVSPRDVIAMADALQELGVRSRSTTTAEHRFPLSSMVQATVEVYTSRSHQ